MNDLDNYKMPWLGKQIARAFVNLARAIKASLPKRDGRITLRGLRVLNWLKRHYIWVLIAIAIFAFGELWFELINRLRLNLFDAVLSSGEAMDAKESPEHLRAYAIVIAATATALIAIATAPFALLKAWVNERLADNAEQSHITERMTKAIEQLGAEKTVYKKGHPTTEPNLEVRLGAIYALERIAQDSERDHIPIMETLCAYIRQNTNEGEAKDLVLEDWLTENRAGGTETTRYERRYALRKFLDSLGSVRPPRDDVHTALTVLTRRSDLRRVHEESAIPAFRINITHANLQLADLSKIDLAGADASSARLAGAYLSCVNLKGASLNGTYMEGADLSGAELQGATFLFARMGGADLIGAKMERAKLFGAKMQGATLRDAEMREANIKGAEMQTADLSHADMQGANLCYANLKSADLQFWSGVRTNCRSADFTAAKNMTQEQVNSMFGDVSTILPNNVRKPDHWADTPLESQFGDDPEYQDWITRGAPPGKPIGV